MAKDLMQAYRAYDTRMTQTQREAVLTVCLMAAFADGDQREAERQQVRALATRLAGEDGEALDLTGPLQRVLLRQVTLDELAATLNAPAHRQLAYEMAVVVCDADGACSEVERRFLSDLRRALALDTGEDLIVQADALVTSPLESASVAGLPVPDAAVSVPSASSAPADAQTVEGDVDAMILKYAILNGALELLPQNLATLAILPLQTKMVYRIGARYGHQLDRRSIGEFLAVLGLGATSQMLENVVRKFLGRFGKTLAGSMGKSAAKWGTGPAMTFATTFGLGHLAKAYYAGGRTLSADDLKARFATLLDQGKTLYQQYRPQVEQQATTINPAQLIRSLSGSGLQA